MKYEPRKIVVGSKYITCFRSKTSRTNVLVDRKNNVLIVRFGQLCKFVYLRIPVRKVRHMSNYRSMTPMAYPGFLKGRGNSDIFGYLTTRC